MQRLLYSLLLSVLIIPGLCLLTGSSTGEPAVTSTQPENPAPATAYEQLYDTLQLDSLVSREAFHQAVEGFYKIESRKRDVLTLIDFSKPSTEKRLFVIDMQKRKLLFSSVVSHGKNSGENYATSFSNENGSHKSSLGFYLTGNTYQGRNGYSLILDGLEKGINARARERAIVMHGLFQSVGHPLMRPSGTQLRLSGSPSGTLPPHHRRHQGRQRHLYLCSQAGVSRPKHHPVT